MKRLSLRKLFFFLVSSETARDCPLCRSGKRNFFYFNVVQSVPCLLMRCQDCFFVYLVRRIPSDQSDFFYNKIYREDRAIENIEHVYERGFRRGTSLKKFLIEKNIDFFDISIGDYGCGYGGLLGAFKECGSELVGYDIDRDAIDFGRKKGLSLFHSDEWSRHSRCFDLIILSHVLEHIYDLDLFIEKIKNRLKKNGIIYIEVPGILSPKVKGRKYSAQVGHLHYFDQSSLSILMNRHGFRQLYLDNKILSLWTMER